MKQLFLGNFKSLLGFVILLLQLLVPRTHWKLHKYSWVFKEENNTKNSTSILRQTRIFCRPLSLPANNWICNSMPNRPEHWCKHPFPVLWQFTWQFCWYVMCPGEADIDSLWLDKNRNSFPGRWCPRKKHDAVVIDKDLKQRDLRGTQ